MGNLEGSYGLTCEIGRRFNALRISPRPPECSAFAFFFPGGSPFLGAGFSFGNIQWTGLNSEAHVLRVWANAWVDTAIPAQRIDPLLMYMARSYTVKDPNGSPQLLKPTQNHLRKGMRLTANCNSPLLYPIAMAIGHNSSPTGTKILDDIPVGAVAFPPNMTGVGTGMANTDFFNVNKNGSHPIVLQGNEGFVLQWGATPLDVGGGGSMTIGFGVSWLEVPKGTT